MANWPSYRKSKKYFLTSENKIGDETLCRILDITSKKKMILEGEIKDAKLSSFSSDFQTFIKH